MAEQDDKLEELNENLYSRSHYQDPEDVRHPLKESDEQDVEREWKSESLDDMLKSERRRKEPATFMKKLFILAVIFFICTVGVGAYIFFGGANFVSSKNVDISVLGPTSVSAGNPVELSVTVTNKNNAKLASASLTIQYPTGTRSADDPTQELTFERIPIGSLSAGGEVTKNIKAVFYGQKGDLQDIKLEVQYTVQGSTATFYKDKTYELAIGDSPVTMKVTGPGTTSSGDSFTTTISVSANSSDTMKNVMVRAEYPYGFTASDSTPSPVSNDNVWSLGDFAPGETKTVTLRGQLIGEDQEERSFRFYVGVSDPGSNNFNTTLYSQLQTIAISKPSVGLNLALNGDSSSTYVAPAGRAVNAVLRYQNNLPGKVINPRIVVALSGPALDRGSVQALSGGFYDSGSNSITWTPENSELVPGDSGQVNFSVASLASGASGKTITLVATVTGRDQNGNNVKVSDSKTIKISSSVNLTSKVLYSRGPFANNGALPPKAEATTTYSVVWDLGNTENDITGGKITARLGQNVTWTGKANPAGDVAYDPEQNLVTWNVGDLSSGTGFSSAGKEAVFQVAFKPSISQIGSVPQLITGATFSGTDSFTDSAVTVTNSALTTRLSNDPKFVQGDEVVVK